MRQIAYMSLSARPYASADIKVLCRSSALKNKRLGITGLLIYDGRRFMQVIEGQDSSVKLLMAQIFLDTRHSHMNYISDSSTENREFPDWSLSSVILKREMGASQFLDEVKNMVVGVKDLKLKASLIGFALLAR